MSEPAATPEPPYYVVLFTSVRDAAAADGYDDTARRMAELAREQDGYLGLESARQDGLGVTVSYWTSLEAIAAWRRHAEHLAAQRLGRERWYQRYTLRVARVERQVDFASPCRRAAVRRHG